jgi:hypothetical protein
LALQVRIAPPAGGVIARVTPLDVFTLLPAASTTVTIGCTENATPDVDEPGEVVKSRREAVPAEIVNVLLTPAPRPGDEAVSVYVPALAIAHSEKVASPWVATTGLAAHVSVAPAGVVIAIVTGAALDAMLPHVSSTLTTG